jgi:hypothetical protein
MRRFIHVQLELVRVHFEAETDNYVTTTCAGSSCAAANAAHQSILRGDRMSFLYRLTLDDVQLELGRLTVPNHAVTRGVGAGACDSREESRALTSCCDCWVQRFRRRCIWSSMWDGK